MQHVNGYDICKHSSLYNFIWLSTFPHSMWQNAPFHLGGKSREITCSTTRVHHWWKRDTNKMMKFLTASIRTCLQKETLKSEGGHHTTLVIHFYLSSFVMAVRAQGPCWLQLRWRRTSFQPPNVLLRSLLPRRHWLCCKRHLSCATRCLAAC